MTVHDVLSPHEDHLLTLRGRASLSVPGQPGPAHQPIPDAGEPIDWNALDSQLAGEDGRVHVQSLPVARAPHTNVTSNHQAEPTSADTQRMVATPTRPVRYHRIVEGDTLRDLASRYLGSPDRYLELFYANRLVLPHPDVLPLHARIVIPDQADPLAPLAPAREAAQTKAASPWNSKPLPREGIRLPEIVSPR